MKYTTSIQKREEVAEGTMAFYFLRPDGFTFKAGQSMDITLENPPETDQKGNTRPYSIASAPHEPELMIATRMRDSAFKRNIRNPELRLSITIEGPMGSPLMLHQNTSRAAIFLAGGIGITPFRSVILDASTRKLPHKLFLFYSNRRPEDAPFLKELMELQATMPTFTCIPTMTEVEKSAQTWEGERGYITQEMLTKYISPPEGPIYYIAGPPEMVLAIRSVLNNAGISDDDIRTEEFSGY